MRELVGRVLLNRYRVESFVGRGGMAEVYLALDTRRSVYVALKVLNEDLAEDFVFLRRFDREARTLELLQHPHIVRFFGFEEGRALAFLVMEYIEGVTLRRYLRLLGRPLTLPEALYISRPVCAALHYAHQKGVYHRDVKPGNIFIEQAGRVVLGDFGIAKLSESSTVTFSTPGTPAYMSPEQCRGEELDARSDIYSLGITVYEMLTLDRPFKGDAGSTTGSRRERVRWEQMHASPPPLRRVNHGISKQAEGTILKALEKDPRRRHHGALEFYRELSRAETVPPAPSLPRIADPEASAGDQSGLSPPSPPSPPQPRVPAVAWGAMGTFALIVIAVLGIVGLRNRPGPDSGTPGAIALDQSTPQERTNTVPAASTPLPTPSTTDSPATGPTAASSPTLTPSSTPSPTSTPTPTPSPVVVEPSSRWTDIGQSVQGRRLSVAIVGYETESAVVVVGSIQGDQPNTRELINFLVSDFEDDIERIPTDVAFHFIPTINPDGNASDERRNARNVDLNRNWDTFDWTTNPELPEGVVRGAGGSRPHSEPETQNLADYLLSLQRQDPNLRVVVWHASRRLSSGGHVYPGYTSKGLDREALALAWRYADVTSYAVKEDWEPYETTGELITWCAEEGIPAIDVVIPRSISGSSRGLRGSTANALMEIARFP